MMGARVLPGRQSFFLHGVGKDAAALASTLVLWQTTSQADPQIFRWTALRAAAVGAALGGHSPYRNNARQDSHFRRESSR